MQHIARALISVYDKTGIVSFAKKLRSYGVEIISTGGTLKHLKKNGVPVTPVSDVTKFPEILDGRVKTLHPMIHGGLLYVRVNKDHKKQILKHGIQPIDLVVVNLYPFTEVIKQKGVTEKKALENIDIGGPTMLRAAAKNFSSVGVICDPADYKQVLTYMKETRGGIPKDFRKKLAEKVFSLTAYYDAAIASFLEGANAFPDQLHLSFEKKSTLRYGENPHQQSAFYERRTQKLDIRQLHGKEISYNNIMDIYAALEIIAEFKQPAASVIKHTNPCGISSRKSIIEAIGGAIDSDPLSAFGGIVILNRRIDTLEAKEILDRLAFFEVLIAPSFSASALRQLKKRKNLRIIETGDLIRRMQAEKFVYRFVDGGVLVQERDALVDSYIKNIKKDLTVVSRKKPTAKDIKELLFAWTCAKLVKSNAIVIAKNHATVGIGAGQMSRVDSMLIATRKAGVRAQDAYVASDGFFPKADNIDVAYQAGVRAIIQPGGSIRDKEVIEAVNRHGLIMVCTGRRHFRH